MRMYILSSRFVPTTLRLYCGVTNAELDGRKSRVLLFRQLYLFENRPVATTVANEFRETEREREREREHEGFDDPLHFVVSHTDE